MDGTFTTILRDIMVILAAGALASASVIGLLVAWQLYRLGRQLYTDLQPILDSVYGTSETVRGTAEFMNTRLHERVGAVLAIAQTSRTLTQLVREFYRGAPATSAPPAPPIVQSSRSAAAPAATTSPASAASPTIASSPSAAPATTAPASTSTESQTGSLP